MDFPKQVRLTNYPFEYCTVNARQNFGVMRILKNASSELTDIFDCNDWVHVPAFKGRLVCFFRDPLSRFLSSVPETLLRFREPLAFQRHARTVVFANNDVYSELKAAAHGSIESFVECYLEILQSGYFDPHHAPQWHFISNFKGENTCDPHVFVVENIEASVAFIAERWNISSAPLTSRNSGANRLKNHRPIKQSAKFLLGLESNYSAVDPEHPLLELSRRTGSSFPHNSLHPKRLDLLKAAELVYRAIRKVESNSEICKTVARMYSIDAELHRETIKLGLGGQLSDVLAQL